MVDPPYIIQLCQALVRLNSINPTLVPGAPGEREIGAFTADTLARLGLEVTRHEPEPGRVSVTGRLRGSGGGKSLMLNAHYDTVGVDGMGEPFSGAVRDGRLYGRGAYDMKGSLAASIGAVKALIDSPTRLRGDVIIAAVADEEYGSVGTADILTRIRTDGAVVTEPTSLDVCLAHKGYCWIEVTTTGHAAHGSKFEQGVDANMRMGWFLAALDGLERELRSRPPHPLVGPPSLHAALLQGGAGLSTYAPSCSLKIERRTVPGETEAQVMAEINAVIEHVAAREPSFQASAHAFFTRGPFEVAPQASIVRALAAAHSDILGRGPRYFGDTPWMDSALTSEAGIETVVFGPGGTGAHADEEWVDTDSMIQCARVLARTAAEYCA
jgi:acetylornithine deacetylase/succinyl-diaminopimelate desuccinylase family protein